MREEDFLKKAMVYQIGVAPVRVDILMGISDIEFKDAWERRSIATLEGVKANIIGIEYLLKSKQSAKRKADILDIKNLRQCVRSKKR
jgi:predicted nucleotidyltransferase